MKKCFSIKTLTVYILFIVKVFLAYEDAFSAENIGESEEFKNTLIVFDDRPICLDSCAGNDNASESFSENISNNLPSLNKDDLDLDAELEKIFPDPKKIKRGNSPLSSNDLEEGDILKFFNLSTASENLAHEKRISSIERPKAPSRIDTPNFEDFSTFLNKNSTLPFVIQSRPVASSGFVRPSPRRANSNNSSSGSAFSIPSPIGSSTKRKIGDQAESSFQPFIGPSFVTDTLEQFSFNTSESKEQNLTDSKKI